MVRFHMRYFAQFREWKSLGKETFTWTSEQPPSVQDAFLLMCGDATPPVEKALLKPAVDGKYVEWDTLVPNDSELVFLPPVSGG